MAALADIVEKKRALDAARPLPAMVVRSIADWFEQELTVAALLTEKAGLSRNDILSALERGKPLRSLPLSAQTLAFNHKQALELMARLAYRSDGSTSERTVVAFHTVLYQGTSGVAGRYRDGAPDDDPGGAPDPAKLRVSMSAFSGWIKRAQPGPETAIEAHARLMRVRPFAQGNAAVALLMTNLILNRAGYPPAVIRDDAQEAYEAAIVRAKTADDRFPLRQLFIDLIDQGLDVCLVGAAHGMEGLADTAVAKA